MIDDCLNRTKVKRGSELAWAKLDEADVALIRGLLAERDELRRRASQLTARAIAEKFGVTKRTIEKISEGETWSHVV